MRLQIALKLIRTMEGLSLRDLAKEIGVSSATLSRIERGLPCDMLSFGRVFTWLLNPGRKDAAA